MIKNKEMVHNNGSIIAIIIAILIPIAFAIYYAIKSNKEKKEED